MENENIIKELAEENAKLKDELQATKEHLKKYTAPSYKKEYMNITKCWIEKQERPSCFQISSFTTSNIKEEVEKVRPS
jgi:hypothetical protein